MDQRIQTVFVRWPRSEFAAAYARGLLLASNLMVNLLSRVWAKPVRVGGWTGKGRLLANLMLLLQAFDWGLTTVCFNRQTRCG